MTKYPFGPSVRKWLLTAFCLAISIAGQASMKTPADSSTPLTAVRVFAEAPLEVLDMIRTSTRLDMIDYYEQADSLLSAVNALGGESRFEQVAPDYLKVSVTPVSTLEIKILQTGKKQTVMTLYTTGDDTMAKDTEIRFFDSELRPLNASKLLKAPEMTDFFKLKGSDISDSELLEKVPYLAVEYTTGPAAEPLKATLTTLRTLSKEDSDRLTTILTPTLSAPWKGKYEFK